MTIEIISEIPSDIDTYHILPNDVTDHTARWYYEILGDGLNEELYYLLACASREPEKAEDIVRLCQYIVDERQREQLENFGKNIPNEDGSFYIPTGSVLSELFSKVLNTKEIEYDITD